MRWKTKRLVIRFRANRLSQILIVNVFYFCYTLVMERAVACKIFYKKQRSRTEMAKKETKTNAMRMLDRMKLSYVTHTYECEEFTDGKQTADLLGFSHEIMFKTLVTVSPERSYFVFVVPIDDEIDLKKAARAAGQKSLSMIHVKELLAVTGYVRGGCTAIGMKKQYPVFLQESAAAHPKIIVSGGKIGVQLEMSPQDYVTASGAVLCDVVREG